MFSDQPYLETGFGRGASWTIFLLGHPFLAVGTVLFGIAAVRARLLPREVDMMFAVLGAFVVVPFIGAVFFAIPFVWLGYLLWSGSLQQSTRVTCWRTRAIRSRVHGTLIPPHSYRKPPLSGTPLPFGIFRPPAFYTARLMQ